MGDLLGQVPEEDGGVQGGHGGRDKSQVFKNRFVLLMRPDCDSEIFVFPFSARLNLRALVGD